ncbi:helix-turn-helix transcriptional regulator [Streptomyces sp. H72]
MALYDGAGARTPRLQAGISVEDLATAAGVCPHTVRFAENGRHEPRPRVADAIARVLGVPVSELLHRERPLTLRDTRWRLGTTRAQTGVRVSVVRRQVSPVGRGVAGMRSASTWAATQGLTPTPWSSAQEGARDLVGHGVAVQARRRGKQSTGGSDA